MRRLSFLALNVYRSIVHILAINISSFLAPIVQTSLPSTPKSIIVSHLITICVYGLIFNERIDALCQQYSPRWHVKVLFHRQQYSSEQFPLVFSKPYAVASPILIKISHYTLYPSTISILVKESTPFVSNTLLGDMSKYCSIGSNIH